MRAGMVKRPEDYVFSSARAHILKKENPTLESFYLLQEIRDWRRYLAEADDEERLRIFRKHILTGRPLGEEKFIKQLEQKAGRILRKLKPGPKEK